MGKKIYNESELIFGEHPKDPRFQDLTGQKFNRLIVLGFSGQSGVRRKMWFCKCDCGKIIKTSGGNLKSGASKSCNCLNVEKTKKANTIHGHTENRKWSPEYHTWRQIRNRVNNPKNKSYPDYGGRGIKLCDHWQSFDNFLADMGTRPGIEYSIERIDNNGDYCPGNCKWATMIEQGNNKRNNIKLTYNGETKNLSQWSRDIRMKRSLLSKRLERGWSVEKTFTTPIMQQYSHKVK